MSAPLHIAIIMDGNRRWAKARGLSLKDGYKAGSESAFRMIEICVKHGIQYLTLYALSTENMSTRNQGELGLLFSVMESNEDVTKLIAIGAKVTFMGNLRSLPQKTREVLDKICDKTKKNKGIFVKIALNYGGRQEIVAAAQKLAQDAKDGTIDIETISIQSVIDKLYDSTMPDPDLLIRTGCDNRMRISNFMLWQIAYSELFFSRTMWPDYTERDFNDALKEFNRRTRMFGQ